MTFNIKDDQGVEAAKEYLNTFSQQERFEIAQITALTKKRGVKIVKELVTSGIEFVDDDYVEPIV
jgi:predicted lactoylglutathione lyase